MNHPEEVGDMNIARNLIFISHATPQDNAFAIWLGARLASAGYAVWSDVTKLIGGERHWDTIEDAIRIHSAKVVSVCSTVSVTKNGFKDELSLALAVERQQNIGDFVIPTRLDGIPFSDFPVELIRRNAIDFNGSWQDGLAKLLKKLEVDSVPRLSNNNTDVLSDWAKSLLQVDGGLLHEEEMLVGSSLPVKMTSLSVSIYKLKSGATLPEMGVLKNPAEVKGTWIFSFSRLDGEDDFPVDLSSQVSIDYFLEGCAEHGKIAKQDANNTVFSLLRRMWENFAIEKGLQGNSFANGKVGFFLPVGEAGIKQIPFKGPNGNSGRRALHGFSAKNNVYWHYAPELIPVLGKRIRFAIIPRVVFSEDGATPLEDVARSHRLRRRFCKSWWQDRWRDMMLAYIAMISDGKESFELPISDSSSIEVSVQPELFSCPVTAVSPSQVDDDEERDVNIDEMDDDYEDSLIETEE